MNNSKSKMVSRQTLWNWKNDRGIPTLDNLEKLEENQVDAEEYALIVIKKYSRFLKNKELSLIGKI